MMTSVRAPILAAALCGILSGPLAPDPARAQPAGPGPDVPLSPEPAVAAEQRAVYDVVHRYEHLLDAADTEGILALYAPDGVAEWNDRPTLSTLSELRRAYDALFKIARFDTAFAYAGIDVRGDTAVVRTFHHAGATILVSGKTVIDSNREVFVLHRIDGAWRIALYIFNADPVQGQG